MERRERECYPDGVRHARVQLVRWCGIVAIAAFALSIGTGALHVAHLLSHARGGASPTAESPQPHTCAHRHVHHGTCAASPTDQVPGGPERSTPHAPRGTHDDCGICVALALAKSANSSPPPPTLLIAMAAVAPAIATSDAPTPLPLRSLSARPPPTGLRPPGSSRLH